MHFPPNALHGSQVANETNNLCVYLDDRASCEAFPRLALAACAPLMACAARCDSALLMGCTILLYYFTSIL